MHLILGAAHDRPPSWWAAKDLHLYAPHEPPCVGDTLLHRELALNTIGLTADGLVIQHRYCRPNHSATPFRVSLAGFPAHVHATSSVHDAAVAAVLEQRNSQGQGSFNS